MVVLSNTTPPAFYNPGSGVSGPGRGPVYTPENPRPGSELSPERIEANKQQVEFQRLRASQEKSGGFELTRANEERIRNEIYQRQIQAEAIRQQSILDMGSLQSTYAVSSGQIGGLTLRQQGQQILERARQQPQEYIKPVVIESGRIPTTQLFYVDETRGIERPATQEEIKYYQENKQLIASTQKKPFYKLSYQQEQEMPLQANLLAAGSGIGLSLYSTYVFGKALITKPISTIKNIPSGVASTATSIYGYTTSGELAKAIRNPLSLSYAAGYAGAEAATFYVGSKGLSAAGKAAKPIANNILFRTAIRQEQIISKTTSKIQPIDFYKPASVYDYGLLGRPIERSAGSIFYQNLANKIKTPISAKLSEIRLNKDLRAISKENEMQRVFGEQLKYDKNYGYLGQAPKKLKVYSDADVFKSLQRYKKGNIPVVINIDKALKETINLKSRIYTVGKNLPEFERSIVRSQIERQLKYEPVKFIPEARQLALKRFQEQKVSTLMKLQTPEIQNLALQRFKATKKISKTKPISIKEITQPKPITIYKQPEYKAPAKINQGLKQQQLLLMQPQKTQQVLKVINLDLLTKKQRGGLGSYIAGGIGSASKQGIQSINLQSVFGKQIQLYGTRQKQKSKQAQSIFQSAKLNFKSGQLYGSSFGQSYKQATRELYKPAARQSFAQPTALRLVTKKLFRQPTPTRQIYSPITKPKTRGWKSASNIYKPLKISTPTYTTSIKRFGRWKPVYKTSDLNKALNFGRLKTETTLASSFKISNAKNVGLPFGYYRSRKEPGVFVEKRARRLNVKSELSELFAYKRSKKKRKKFDLF